MKQSNSTESNGTRISLLYRGLNPRSLWQGMVEGQIKALQHLASIASARITLEHRHESTPGFRVFAILEVPGPDFHAEATDYTLRAALLKVIGNLRHQMQSRKNRQVARRKKQTRTGFSASPNFSRA